jgi:hypothetical protein
MLAGDRADDERALIARLLTDERMRGVWREIAKCQASPVARDRYFGLFGDVVHDGQSDHDVAVGLFFFYAYFFAHHQVETETVAIFRARFQSMLESVERLREEAQHMHGQLGYGDPEVLKHVAAIEAAADFYEREASRIYGKPHPSVVGRNQGDPRQRAFALMMADEARKLFGRSMYGTVAALTSVALADCDGGQVSAANVRDWVRLSPKS